MWERTKPHRHRITKGSHEKNKTVGAPAKIRMRTMCGKRRPTPGGPLYLHHQLYIYIYVYMKERSIFAKVCINNVQLISGRDQILFTMCLTYLACLFSQFPWQFLKTDLSLGLYCPGVIAIKTKLSKSNLMTNTLRHCHQSTKLTPD